MTEGGRKGGRRDEHAALVPLRDDLQWDSASSLEGWLLLGETCYCPV